MIWSAALGAFPGTLQLGPIEFASPAWLLLAPPLWALALWIGRRNLSGLAGGSRVAAMIVRLIVIGLFACALAEPRLRDEAEHVAVTAVLDVSRSIPTARQARVEKALAQAADAHKQPGDSMGVISVAADALVQALPTPGTTEVHKADVGETMATNLADGVRLALATAPRGAGLRIVVFSDGNQTQGSILQAAQAARAKDVPIDVVPYTYNFEHEVIAEQIIVPATARMGETADVRVVLSSRAPARGLLTILVNDQPIDLDEGDDSPGVVVDLDRGTNVLTVPVPLTHAGPQQFRAQFEPLPSESGQPVDAIVENNVALGTTFVSGEGRVLIVSGDPSEYSELVRVLTEARIETEVLPPASLPATLTGLNAYDAIILMNQPVWNFSLAQQENLVQYVRDSGGGLIMTGGPQAFGAGGWIGSPVAKVLPVQLDPPQKRQRLRGALVLVMHSIEMPEGVHYGKKIANLAVDALSRLDLAGIVEYPGMGIGAQWVHPLSEVGDKSAIKRAIGNLRFGDMPSFDPSLQLALTALRDAKAGAKHVIVVSDGDPSLSRRLMQQYRKAQITISAVGVYPHSPADYNNLKYMAMQTGGKFYAVASAGQLGNLPQIITSEAVTVSRPLIEEGDIQPTLTTAPSEPMRGIHSPPQLKGYIVTGPRSGFAVTTLLGKEGDVISAHWQHGLGRVVAFTSDVSARWAKAWLSWPQFAQFWEQHVRWAMRPSGDAIVNVTTESEGDTTRVIVEATDPSGERLNFARFQGRVSTPDGTGVDIELQQVGPGRYEGQFTSDDPGSYLVSLRYAAPNEEGDPYEGSVQAAVERPFADEFRAVRDNAALLAQVAEMTGGQVITDLSDPAQADLWRHAGITMPVATRPIWLEVALCALAVFLVDVAVRRVRIDIGAIRASIAGAFSTRRAPAGEVIGTLQAARSRTRAGRTGEDEGAQRRTTRYEASPEQLAKGANDPVTTGGPAPVTKKPKRGGASDTESRSEEDEGISRLMRAKRRARDEYDDPDDTTKPRNGQ